jgi:glycosyltransferase involved in cell wall biosynthesis
MQQIRILHIVSSLNIGSGVMGVIMNYYHNINRDNIQFDFLYFTKMPDTFETEIRKLGGNTYYLLKPSLKRYFKVHKEYVQFFKENAHKYKAVHLHVVSLNFFVLPIAKKYGVKNLITHSHNTKYSDKKISALRNRILCIPLKKWATHFFACSRAAGEFLYGKKYFDKGKVAVINNAIDCEKFKYNEFIRNKMRRELGIQDKFVIGHVGRFAKQKNHYFLLEIFAKIIERKANSILMLIGDGPLFEEIKNKAKLLGIEESVMFLGRKSNVEDCFQAMDVFVLPSLFEGLGIVLLEAQCAGLPCYASDVVPNDAKISNNFNYLSLGNKPAEWANEILKNLDHHTRSDGRLSIFESGFVIQSQAKNLEKFYLNLRE